MFFRWASPLPSPVLVVAVVGVLGGEAFEEVVEVFQEAGFVVVDEDAGGDVHGGDEHHALAEWRPRGRRSRRRR